MPLLVDFSQCVEIHNHIPTALGPSEGEEEPRQGDFPRQSLGKRTGCKAGTAVAQAKDPSLLLMLVTLTRWGASHGLDTGSSSRYQSILE